MKLLMNILAVGAFALSQSVLVAAEKKAASEAKESANPAEKDPHAEHKKAAEADKQKGHHGEHKSGECCDKKDCCKECDSSSRAGDHKGGKHSCCDDKAKAKECCKKCDDDKCKKACKSGHCKKGHCEDKKAGEKT